MDAGRPLPVLGRFIKGGHGKVGQLRFEERLADLRWRQTGLTGALVAVRKPTIAALPGAAAGAGLAIALACDMRIAAKSAFCATGYARVGLSGDYGIAWLLTRIDAAGAGRAYAAYGGVYICASLLWLWAVEGMRPDRWDALGAVLCIVGAGVILLAPRAT